MRWAVVLLALMLVSPAFGGDQPAQGGQSGAIFRAQCKPGEVLVGFSGRSGNLLDLLRPLCARFNDNAAMLEPPQPFPKAFGGAGGQRQFRRTCAANQAVTELRVTMNAEPPAVATMALQCATLDRAMTSEQRNVADLESARLSEPTLWHGISACPGGEIAIGVHGRMSQHLDSIGLICGSPARRTPPSKAVSATPSPAPPPKLAIVRGVELRDGERVLAAAPSALTAETACAMVMDQRLQSQLNAAVESYARGSGLLRDPDNALGQDCMASAEYAGGVRVKLKLRGNRLSGRAVDRDAPQMLGPVEYDIDASFTLILPRSATEEARLSGVRVTIANVGGPRGAPMAQAPIVDLLGQEELRALVEADRLFAFDPVLDAFEPIEDALAEQGEASAEARYDAQTQMIVLSVKR